MKKWQWNRDDSKQKDSKAIKVHFVSHNNLSWMGMEKESDIMEEDEVMAGGRGVEKIFFAWRNLQMNPKKENSQKKLYNSH